MRTGSGQAGDPPAAGQQAEPAISSPFAATWLVAWHSDLAAWLDRLGWLPTLSDWLTPLLGPVPERHPDNLSLDPLPRPPSGAPPPPPPPSHPPLRPCTGRQ